MVSVNSLTGSMNGSAFHGNLYLPWPLNYLLRVFSIRVKFHCLSRPATSDKEGPKKQGCVRSRVNFGQGRPQKTRWCPKSCQLRTREVQQSKMVSEVVLTSDKGGPTKQDCVRSHVNFGQERPQKTRWCPKGGGLLEFCRNQLFLLKSALFPAKWINPIDILCAYFAGWILIYQFLLGFQPNVWLVYPFCYFVERVSYNDFSIGTYYFFDNFLQLILDSCRFEAYVPRGGAVLIKRLIDREICWSVIEKQQ